MRTYSLLANNQASRSQASTSQSAASSVRNDFATGQTVEHPVNHSSEHPAYPDGSLQTPQVQLGNQGSYVPEAGTHVAQDQPEDVTADEFSSFIDEILEAELPATNVWQEPALSILDSELRDKIRTLSQEIHEIKRSSLQQETMLRNYHQSLISNIQSLRSWGEQLASENAYLKHELQRVKTDFENCCNNYERQHSELVNLQTQIGTQQFRAADIRQHLINLSNFLNQEFNPRVSTIMNLCQEQ